MNNKIILSESESLENRKSVKPVITVVNKVKEKQYVAVGTCHCSL